MLDERPWAEGTVPGMAACSGSEFLGRLASARVHVEIQGQTLTGGVADHPAFRNVVRSYAELFDLQHDPAYRDILTYPSPLTGRAGRHVVPGPEDPGDLAKTPPGRPSCGPTARSACSAGPATT